MSPGSIKSPKHGFSGQPRYLPQLSHDVSMTSGWPSGSCTRLPALWEQPCSGGGELGGQEPLAPAYKQLPGASHTPWHFSRKPSGKSWEGASSQGYNSGGCGWFPKGTERTSQLVFSLGR